MKRLATLFAALALATFAYASEFEKKGFLTTKSCAEKGIFADCPLEAYSCGKEGCFLTNEPGINKPDELVLFVHNDGKFYNVDAKSFPRSELDHGVSKNEVTIIGEFDKRKNTIVVHEFKAPPPPKKSFFKGCL